MSDLQLERWHGDPADRHQPDVGDVLAYVDPATGFLNGPIMRVRHARPVRGREHEPHELMLTLETGHVGDLQTDGQVFSAVKNRRRRS